MSFLHDIIEMSIIFSFYLPLMFTEYQECTLTKVIIEMPAHLFCASTNRCLPDHEMHLFLDTFRFRPNAFTMRCLCS